MPIHHRQLPAPVLPRSPADMLRFGAQLLVTLTIPPEFAQQLRAGGKPSVGSVGGNALIDTGAGFTCVNPNRLKDLGFDPQPGSRHTLDIAFTDSPLPSRRIDVSPEDRVFGDAPDLLMLFGRDLLQDFVFIYNGPTGEFTLAL